MQSYNVDAKLTMARLSSAPTTSKLMIKIAAFPILLLLLIGCGGYNMQEVRIALERGQVDTAYKHLEKKGPKEPNIPHQFELGLIAHYADLFVESNKAFGLAENIAEERYTKSLSKEALSLVTTDKIRPYPGTRYERLFGHYYHTLNYIYLNQLDEALVECRRATGLINYFRGEDEKYDAFGAGFLAYLTGTVYEAVGEWNNALISYKQAAAYYQAAAKKTGVPMPPDVGHAVVRLAQMLNFTDDFERYRKQYGEPPTRPKNYGELILFYETGYVPRKRQQTLTFPILTTDFGDDDDDDDDKKKTERFIPTLLAREGMEVDDIELEYLLHVAMPTIRSERPRFAGIQVSVGEEKAHGVLIEDIERVAIETLKAERPVTLLRTLGRALLKYLTFRKADKKNEILGALVNIAAVVTEKADTRSWQTLPNQIFMVRMPLPAGTHKLQFSFLDANGQGGRDEPGPGVEIQSNRITFWNHRSYE